ncbi:M50 family metallopeptidase [[Clostridium] polysaccharolyticum]|uniref:Putative peptide zinc metalloprotease protein n=1 Tax=[Clostridium] polysaccharolyticum TaxID=29364 RepID=A0A1I0EES2_9FIRM|nr:M50 family metallopeptidase [[Clostridium] polysaccharolyticum]SET43726.1 putative peptide zinc metalloprotease protein [[Clostridium] polysaccharolyticum]
MAGTDIVISLQGDHYMVESAGGYFKLGTREGRILQKLVNEDDTTRILEEEQITKEQLDQYIDAFKNVGVIGEQKKKRQNILFYRIPLFQADPMFARIVACMKNHKEAVKGTFITSILVILAGCILMGINFGDIYSRSLLHLKSYEYATIYVVFLLTVCMHEMGHGIVCKYNGGKVGTLGFMLIIFSPAMYCDISGVRMIKDKRKQIMASAAGVYVNLFFTGLASIAFAIKPLPLFAAFIILNVTTIVSNLIPVVRLDGYWILSFATGITNLYKNSMKSVNLLFKKCTGKERFMAIYGVITYSVMGIAIVSIAVSAVKTVIWVAQYVFHF